MGVGARETELAWAAGFFDGEGCVTRNRDLPGSRKTLRVRLDISIAQAGTTEHLERFRAAIGFGRINGPYTDARGNGNRQSMYYLRYHGKKAHEVMRILSPYLCSPKVARYDAIVMEGVI